ncbi:alpha/beta hydrolase fold domain-containing protein [Ancylobacter sp. IITR112]|uniref:alpha/beta hydrolase fold domain-containing protein n=1 Tax=Ancylobacter sp. IITR112 TaxID=3138073 RepID=UPI00352B7261
MHDVEITRDHVYAEIGELKLLADLYRPITETPPPLVIYIHGGGWAVGSRADGADTRLRPFAALGLAVLSIDYRLVDTAHFPAQLHDVKAAIRWARARGAELGVDAGRIAVWGASAGALLASLAGLTAGQPEMDGVVGAHVEQSTAVGAVVSWFGQSDLRETTHRSWLETLILPFNFEAGLLGVESVADVAKVPELARSASPVSWVGSAAPPFLIAHGDRDRVILASESEALHAALVRAGARSVFALLGGAGHEDHAFDAPENLAMTAGFLRGVLR